MDRRILALACEFEKFEGVTVIERETRALGNDARFMNPGPLNLFFNLLAPFRPMSEASLSPYRTPLEPVAYYDADAKHADGAMLLGPASVPRSQVASIACFAVWLISLVTGLVSLSGPNALSMVCFVTVALTLPVGLVLSLCNAVIHRRPRYWVPMLLNVVAWTISIALPILALWAMGDYCC